MYAINSTIVCLSLVYNTDKYKMQFGQWVISFDALDTQIYGDFACIEQIEDYKENWADAHMHIAHTGHM